MKVLVPSVNHKKAELSIVTDSVVLPVLRDAGIVEGYEGIVPAAVYGRTPTSKDEGSIGILYGSYDALVDEINKVKETPKPYFNPHGSTRTKGMSLAKKAKGRGEIFAKSSYLLQSADKQHLVIEGNEMPWFDVMTARQMVVLYELSAITIARTVTITENGEEMGALSPIALLPGLLRETAQNILPVFKNHEQRVEALQSAVVLLAKGQAPKY